MPDHVPDVRGLDEFADVDLTVPPSDGQALVWDGTAWAPGDL